MPSRMPTRSRSILLLICAAVPALGASAGRSAVPSCAAREGGSRWEPSPARQYRAKEAFGRGTNGPFAGIQSVVVAKDAVYANDSKSSVVTVLSPDLKLVRRIELRVPTQGMGIMMGTMGNRRLLDVTDSAVYVYDGKGVTAFSHAGASLGETRLIPAGLAPFSVIGIQAVGPNLLFGVDSISREERHLQLWSAPLKGGAATRVPFDVALRGPKGGVMVLSRNNPRPLWVASGRCVIASDGENEWILRHALDSRMADTIRLPRLEVQAQADGDDDNEKARELLGALQARRGVKSNPLGAPGVGGTGVLRWTDMIVDPDGYLWIELRRPPNDAKAAVHVYRVNLATGAVEKDVLPAFPAAFGPPGSYYARATDASGTPYVARYELTPSR
ncbi:MAG: hypothetical protein JWM41_373 [Gemmatimonadetes bacterium]|nr:hypothetical protein [Gemmatimonadota bacterium]